MFDLVAPVMNSVKNVTVLHIQRQQTRCVFDEGEETLIQRLFSASRAEMNHS